jgi:hypothetical protein
MLLGDGACLWVETFGGSDYLWTVKPDEKPVADIRLIADLLSGETSEEQGGLTPKRSALLQSNWERLRILYPATFSASAADIQSWHENVTKECESRNDSYGAAYHLKILAQTGNTQPQR